MLLQGISKQACGGLLGRLLEGELDGRLDCFDCEVFPGSFLQKNQVIYLHINKSFNVYTFTQSSQTTFRVLDPGGRKITAHLTKQLE